MATFFDNSCDRSHLDACIQHNRLLVSIILELEVDTTKEEGTESQKQNMKAYKSQGRGRECQPCFMFGGKFTMLCCVFNPILRLSTFKA